MYVYDQAHALAKAIKESAEYKLVKTLKDKIETDPQLKKMFNDYRTKQFEIQKLQIMGQQVPEDKTKGLQQLHEIVTANTTIRQFLEAEHCFGIMLGDIQKILLEGLDLN